MITPPARFFMSCQPGLEKALFLDLQYWLDNLKDYSALLQEIATDPPPPVLIVKGGIELDLPLDLAMALNAFVKTPHRILMRLKHFRCRDFPRLFQRTLAFEWENFLALNQELHVEVSTQQSRLKMKKRIAETCTEAIQKRLKQSAKSAASACKNPQNIFVRFFDDECEISLDLSGEHLHRRGYRQLIGHAPLRESLAASLLLLLLDEVSKSKRETINLGLFDPMMGAGTFLLEALALRIGPLDRHFSYQDWPLYKNSPELRQAVTERHKSWSQKTTSPFAQFWGSDLDAEMIKVSQNNLAELKKHFVKQSILQKKDFQLWSQDFLTLSSLPLTKAQPQPATLVVCNPPYGDRLKIDSPKDFFKKLFEQLQQLAGWTFAGMIVPHDIASQKPWPKQLKLVQAYKLSNGGIPVQWLIFKKYSA